jgi:dTDP-glucose pyrophosphorylase
MKQWEQTLIGPDGSLRDALDVIDRGGSQMALVVDAERRLLGTLSDGDIRRGLLKGLRLEDKVVAAMHRNPTCAPASGSRDSVLATMRRLGVHQVPIVDDRRIVVGLSVLDDFLAVPDRGNWVVIMAGGLGSRLKELTSDTPKPMLRVGAQPLLETIVRGYIEHGFRQFYFAVNYKAEQIESYFGDGDRFGIRIEYLRERNRMGTAGALSLLPAAPEQPIIVTNADLLTRQDYGAMMDKHLLSGAAATMAVRDYEMQVPFGVVHERDGKIEAIEEKPIQRFVVSAGIYVLSPAAVGQVPPDKFTDMPGLFQTLAQVGMSTRCHFVDGYWLDIGRLPDYERANLDFDKVFR